MHADIILEYKVDVKPSQKKWTSSGTITLIIHFNGLYFSISPLLFVLLFSFLPDFYNFLLVGAAVLTQTRLHFFVIGPHGM